MNKLISFVKTSLLGGLLVILPVTIILFMFQWLFVKVTRLIQPLTNLVLSVLPIKHELLGDLIVLTVIIVSCFFIGAFVKTHYGKILWKFLDKKLSILPGYSIIKDTITQFIGNEKSTMGDVAIVRPFKNSTLQTGFITDEYMVDSTGQKLVTVFVPTGPNPTSGMVYHLTEDQVIRSNVTPDRAIKSILSCGAGSAEIVNGKGSHNQ
ncbi:DUF502 domain-containing protein [Desulfococcaceae bacterium HSG9]|nr:DUF502 domain-containing protein [Desulfococcaceae bacterium HSG9]